MKKYCALTVLLLCFLFFCLPAEAAADVGYGTSEWKLICSAGKNELTEKEAEAYSASLVSRLKQTDGVLSTRKYTEYSRTVLTLTAIGRDPSSVGGYQLLSRLEETDMVLRQGINGPIWALIALDSGDYKSAVRKVYLEEILGKELPEGGWNMEGKGKADPDVTAMALQALSRHTDEPRVKKAAERGLAALSRLQEADGGFSSWGTKNSESVSQVIIALCELGIPLTDSRFVKNGHTALDSLMSFCLADGSYMHTKESGKKDSLATEQAETAMTELWRRERNLAPLFQMTSY